jgi:hypothetical protein
LSRFAEGLSPFRQLLLAKGLNRIVQFQSEILASIEWPCLAHQALGEIIWAKTMQVSCGRSSWPGILENADSELKSVTRHFFRKRFILNAF